MSRIAIIIAAGGARRWHQEVGERLAAEGHSIDFVAGMPQRHHFLAELVMKIEALVFRIRPDNLLRPVALTPLEGVDGHDLVIDLTGCREYRSANTICLISDSGDFSADLEVAVARGELPNLYILRGDGVVARARPMIDNRVSIARAMEDVLARAVSLTVATAIAALNGEIADGRAVRPIVQRQQGFLGAYVSAALPRLVREVRRRRKYRPAHWRVGYRRARAAEGARTGDLSGPEWSVVPDNGERFYADPFPFVVDGKAYIFVEDYSHAAGKACISVIAIDEAGAPGEPVPVIEAAHHLSYPQVFEMAGNVWMLPESSSAEELVLYKAERFPYIWKRHATLIAGRALSDATLLQHDGALWLFATDADGAGSTSDLMVVYRADRLEGPWLPHPANPIVIDRGQARPGGGFIREHGRLFLPVQNGTEGYGGGLGLIELLRLDETAVEFSRPNPIVNNSNWPYPKIHTYNRVGGFEVIDGIAEVPR